MFWVCTTWPFISKFIVPLKCSLFIGWVPWVTTTSTAPHEASQLSWSLLAKCINGAVSPHICTSSFALVFAASAPAPVTHLSTENWLAWASLEVFLARSGVHSRSEERRVGKEC